MQERSTFTQFATAVAQSDEAAAESLCAQLNADDEPQLLALAQSATGDERWWAVYGLAHCGSQAAIATLSALLEDADSSVRAAAALALAHIHRRVAGVDPLATSTTPSSVEPPSTPRAGPQYLDQLAALLDDSDGLVRQTASAALALCGDDAVPVLQAVLEESHQGPRTRAAHALRKIATLPAAIVLYRYLDDSNHLVRTHAYEALDALGLLENQLVVL